MVKIQPPSSTLHIVTDASAQTSTSSNGEFFIPLSKLSITMCMAIDALIDLVIDEQLPDSTSCRHIVHPEFLVFVLQGCIVGPLVNMDFVLKKCWVN